LPVGDYLLAWPGEERWLRFSVPGPFRPLEWELVLPAAESADGSLPVLLCDRKTGELVQRLNLPGSPLRAAMAWPGKPSGDEVRPQLRASSAGLLVVAGDRAWGLKSK
jgi:hypothetical protein